LWQRFDAADKRSVDEGIAPARAPAGEGAGVTADRDGRAGQRNYDLVVIGAGPAGIALAAEARAAGVSPQGVLVLERAPQHSWVIRKYYPEGKPVLANYKGIEARCDGVLCIPDSTREETLTYLDRAIQDSGARVLYGEEVRRIGREARGRLRVESTSGVSLARVVVIAIGILGRPNKPSYAIPRAVKDRVFFDVTSQEIQGRDVLVVGGGDTATEYSQFLAQGANRVTLAYRGASLTRPNPINRESVLALERQGKLRILFSCDVVGLEASGKKVHVRFAGLPGRPIDFDHVVFALGGTTPQNFLKAAGIAFDGPHPRLTESFRTSVPGLFLAGDLTAGKTGGSIILAFNTAAAAMRRICEDHGICRVGPGIVRGS
jgi:thioredoxin reductase (NADPH)